MTKSQFRKNYEAIEDLLIGFAMRLTRNRDNAKDLYQETLCKAYTNIHRFKEGTNFKAWMTTIMHNTFVNDYRKKRTRNKAEAPIENYLYAVKNKPSQDDTESKIMMKELKVALNNLNEANRVPFLMHFEGYQYNEIAEKLDIKMGTVKSRIFFARKKLQEELHHMYQGEVRA